MVDDEVMKSWRDLRKNAARERNKAPLVTCPSSRHVHIMAERLWKDGGYTMFSDEPKHCAESMYSVLLSLWAARHRILELEKSAGV